MLLLFFLVSTEIFASVLAVISPLIPNNVILVFILIAAIKLTLTMRLDLDSDPKAILLQIAVTMFYDTGVLLRFLSGAISRISELKESFFCVSCGILLGYIIFKFISTVIPKLRPAKKLATWITISVIVFHTAICTVYFLRKTNLGDGSIYILRSYTFQLPELMKLEIISITFIVSELVKNNRKYLLLLYITSGFCLCTLVIVFREIGTALLIIYFTLLAAFKLSASDAEYKSKTLSFLTSKAFPLTMGTFFFVTVGIVKRLLLIRYQFRGEAGELIYGINDKLFSISSRLSADSSQIQSARDSLEAALPVQLQLNTELCISHASAKTALSDYAYICIASGFGRWIAPLLFLIFALFLLLSVSKSSNVLAKAATIMILSQVWIQISGLVCKFAFTGISVPYFSPGGSSAICSFALFTIILFSMRRKER